MINLPNLTSAIVGAGGRLIEPWVSYLWQINRAPSPISIVDVSASPFAYTAKEPGYVHVSGGTVSAVTFTRGTATALTVATGMMIPVQIGDTITVTYSVLPNIKFVPNYGSLRN